MCDREKAIKGLESIVNDDWMWKNADYYAAICKDALAMLKAQEPRVMTLKEVQEWKQPEIWLESREPYLDGDYINPTTRLGWAFLTSIAVDTSTNPPTTNIVNYGKKFRAWTARPTDAQREATPWQK